MNIIDDINFAQDPRNCGRDAEQIILYLEDGTEFPMPIAWVVCPVCDGKGTHVNPAIDCGGISREDFDEDPEFEASYRRGDYDQRCNKCGGRTTVPGVDFDGLEDHIVEAYRQQLREERAGREEQLAEIRMGA